MANSIKRLFFALNLPEELKVKLLLPFTKIEHSAIRWMPMDNLHITAHFVGATPVEKLTDIIKQSESICSAIAPFTMAFKGFKVVNKDRKPSMIWAQFDDNSDFEKLSYTLREVFPTDESRKPNPHLTLARIRQLRKVPFELPKVKSFSCTVDFLELWESQLSSKGARYELVEKWKFKG